MILLVDDDRRTQHYQDELEYEGYKVYLQTNVDDAWRFFNKHINEIDLLVLDIVMPPGNSLKRYDTKQGRRTGVLFYDRIRKKAPDIPIIILTVLDDDDIVKKFSMETGCWYYHKQQCLPYDLVQIIEKIVGRTKRIQRRGE